MRPIWRAALVVVMAMTALPLVAQAQLRPAGPEFELAESSMITSWRLAPYSYGNFLVLQGGGWHNDLAVQRYDSVGRPHGGPILIAHPNDNNLLATAFAVAPEGHFLVAWQWSEMGWRRREYAIVDNHGEGLFWGELSDTLGYCEHRAAAAGNGDFVLAQTTQAGIEVRVHDRTGAVTTPPFTVSAAPSAHSVTLLADRDGNFWVSWSERTDAGSVSRSRRFDRWGHPLTEALPQRMNGTSCASGDSVSITVIDEQGTLKVRFRRPDGTPSITYEAALGYPTDYLWLDAPSCDAANNVVLAFSVWDYILDVSEAYAVRFRADGTRDGPIFRVSSLPPDGHTGWAAVTGDPSGNVLIAWESWLGARARVFHIPPKGDFDGDLGADLVLRDEETGATRLWMMDEGVRNGNVMVWPGTPGPDWRLAGVDDFDGDRRQDLVFQNDATGAVEFELLSGPDGNEVVGAGPLAGAPGPDWELCATGDFSHDGWPDLLWRHRTTQQLAVWTMQRTVHTGTLVPHPDRADSADWSVVSADDWNGDGMRDLLWYNRATGRLVQWLLDGDLVRLEGRFTNPPAAADANWKVVAAGDFGLGPGGLAGTPDVVWRNQANGYQVIWYFDFDGNRTAGIYTTPSAPKAGWRAAGPH